VAEEQLNGIISLFFKECIMRSSYRFAILGAMLLLLFAASCGGSKNVGTLAPPATEDGRVVTGVTLDGFEVIRYNNDGVLDSALNPTLDLDVVDSGNGKALKINVNDVTPQETVLVEVRYNGSVLSAKDVEYHGLVGDEVVTASFLNLADLAAIGQVPIGDAAAEIRSGDFATVYFDNTPQRAVTQVGGGMVFNSDAGAGTVIYEGTTDFPYADTPNIMVDVDDGAETVDVMWHTAFIPPDGNGDGTVSLADITPIAQNFNKQVATTWDGVIADYNRDTVVSLADITSVAQNFNTGVEGFNVYVTAGDATEPGATPDQTVLWADADDDAGATVTDGELFPLFNRYTVSYAFADLLPVADASNMVKIWVTPYNGDNLGNPASVDAEVGEPVPPADQFVITDYVIQVAGTGVSGGEGDNNDEFDSDTQAITAPANTGVDLSLMQINGTFNGYNFSGDTPPAELDADGQAAFSAAYTTAFGEAVANMTWQFAANDAADANFRYTSTALALDSGDWPVTGADPGAATVFPDDDDESTGAGAEGLMTTILEASSTGTYTSTDDLEVTVLSNIQYDYTVDVAVDPAAPVMTAYFDELGDPLTEFYYIGTSTIIIEMDWGSGGEPADLAETELHLCKVGADGFVDPEPANCLALGYTEEEVTVGQYTIKPNPEPDTDNFVMTCMISGSDPKIDSGSEYVFRVFDGTTWSSINKPETILETTTPPPSAELIPVPRETFPDVDVLFCFYQDDSATAGEDESAVIRRNPGLEVDTFQTPPQIVPEDEAKFNDLLKQPGQEFPVTYQGGWWPQGRVQETTDPQGTGWTNPITGLDDPNNIDTAIIPSLKTNPGRVGLDLSSITLPGGGTEDQITYYAVKFYLDDGYEIGNTWFMNHSLGQARDFYGPPVGVDWGINIFDDAERGDLMLADRDFSDKVVDGNSVLGDPPPTPDILWIEWRGGWVYDTQVNEEGVYLLDPPSDNVHARVKQVGTEDSFWMELGLRLAGVTAQGNYLGLHVMTKQAWYKQGDPLWPGKLRPETLYEVQLDDPNFTGIDFTFTDNLNVVGVNPNSP
jgi:hypothetical protein